MLRQDEDSRIVDYSNFAAVWRRTADHEHQHCCATAVPPAAATIMTFEAAAAVAWMFSVPDIPVRRLATCL